MKVVHFSLSTDSSTGSTFASSHPQVQPQGTSCKGTQPFPLLPPKSHTPCYCCGRKHASAQCRFKIEVCRVCNNVGHIVKTCHSKRRDQPQGKGQPTHKVEGVPPSGEYTMYPIVEQQAPSIPLKTTEALEGKELHMEVDTGASLSPISELLHSRKQKSSCGPTLDKKYVC